MSGGGGFAVTRSHGGDDRFYSTPAAMRRHHHQQQQQHHQQQQHQQQQQQHLLQQQHHNHYLQSLQRHHQILYLQQQQQIHLPRYQQQHQFQRPSPLGPHAAAARAENRLNSGDSKATFPIPPAILPPLPPITNVSNLDRLLQSVTPLVPANTLNEVSLKGRKSREAEVHLFYDLGDLWETYREWSVYGVGVPLVLNGSDSIVQYYVPYLSGIQLYVDPLKPQPRLSRRPGIGSEDDSSQRDKVVNISHGDEAAISNSPGRLIFEYLEQEQPYNRLALTDKVSFLESKFPELRMYRSCDLLPSSWMCVAWYPIYRIPVGPTLKDLDASFLTFHSLSTHFRSPVSGQPCVPRPRVSGQDVHAAVGSSSKVSLPVFGLASYKYKGSLLDPCGTRVCEQESTLLEAAGDWLKRLQVLLPDYQFFLSHYPKRR